MKFSIAEVTILEPWCNQVDAGLRRLLYVGEGSHETAFGGFFSRFSQRRHWLAEYTCSDMLGELLKVPASRRGIRSDLGSLSTS